MTDDMILIVPKRCFPSLLIILGDMFYLPDLYFPYKSIGKLLVNKYIDFVDSFKCSLLLV